MEQEMPTVSRGTPEGAAWLREQIAELGLTQSAIARQMVRMGDDRQLKTILRWLGRMMSGEARVSGEMRFALGLWRQHLREIEVLEKMIEVMSGGELRSFINRGAGEVDTTAASLGRARDRLIELRRVWSDEAA